MMKPSDATRHLGAAAAFLALALGFAGTPAYAQLVFGNPRVNNGEIRVDPLLCQTDRQIRRAIARAGFSNVYLNAPIGTHVRARGTRSGVVYLIEYDYCLRPGIVNIMPLRHAR
jgi:hypothetical protein